MDVHNVYTWGTFNVRQANVMLGFIKCTCIMANFSPMFLQKILPRYMTKRAKMNSHWWPVTCCYRTLNVHLQHDKPGMFTGKTATRLQWYDWLAKM